MADELDYIFILQNLHDQSFFRTALYSPVTSKLHITNIDFYLLRASYQDFTVTPSLDKVSSYAAMAYFYILDHARMEIKQR